MLTFLRRYVCFLVAATLLAAEVVMAAALAHAVIPSEIATNAVVQSGNMECEDCDRMTAMGCVGYFCASPGILPDNMPVVMPEKTVFVLGPVTEPPERRLRPPTPPA